MSPVQCSAVAAGTVLHFPARPGEDQPSRHAISAGTAGGSAGEGSGEQAGRASGVHAEGGLAFSDYDSMTHLLDVFFRQVVREK